LIKALREIKNAGVPMSSEVARKVVCSFHRSASGNDRPQVLTDREEGVLKLLAEGFLSKEIAARLSINVQTVNYHLKQIYRKYHVRSRTEAAIKYLTYIRSIEPNS
jgi:DNA-binding NarL/FixJ family response regulator